MKKCSKPAHDALTELNITPLLDLAFVLLVIFIITTIPPVKDVPLKLPTASKHEKDPPHKANYIVVEANGNLWLNKREVTLVDLQSTLVGLREDDPDLNIIVRGDAKTKYKQIRAVLDVCQQANVPKVDPGDRTCEMIPQSQPRKKRNSSKVNLLISFAFHALLVVVVLYFAARSGLLGQTDPKDHRDHGEAGKAAGETARTPQGRAAQNRGTAESGGTPQGGGRPAGHGPTRGRATGGGAARF